VSSLYDEVQNTPVGDEGLSRILNLQETSDIPNDTPMRKDLYADVLANARLVLIERMAKPEEVCLNVTPNGLLSTQNL